MNYCAFSLLAQFMIMCFGDRVAEYSMHWNHMQREYKVIFLC